jgi:hypothetical protein
MASILKVDTLTGVTTAGSISVTGEGNSTTTNLQQGLAKAWVHINMSTAANVDSFNIASITDDGSGTFDATYTTAQATANYVICTAGDDNTGGNSDLVTIIGAPTNQAQLGTWRSAQGRADTTKACASIHGDLA